MSNTKRAATIADLKGKPRRKQIVTIDIPDASGEIITHEITLRAIGAKRYDQLVDQCPPTAEQKADGANYNPDEFGPRLISACSYDPEITVNDAVDLWNSEDWSRGEILSIFQAAVQVCSKGLDVPFTDPGSGTTPSSDSKSDGAPNTDSPTQPS